MTITRRALAVLAVGGLMFALAPPAHAAQTEKAFYTHGTDKASWFWEKQFNQQVGGADAPGGVSHRQGLPSPQSADTLPVAAENGEAEKISSIAFDLVSRDVIAGSTITKLTITLVEMSDRSEHQQFNAGGKVVEACLITEFWPSGEAEVWDGQPEHDDKACAEGKRKAGQGENPATWTFDLTSLVADWGTNPSAAQGVLLKPVIDGSGPSETWQINLKRPARDDDLTEENEYKQTRNRAAMTVTFEPPAPEEPEDTGSIPPSAPTDTSFPSSTSSFGSSSPSGFGDTSTATAPTTSPATEDAGTEQAAPQAAPVAQARPELPGIVWALIPIGLLALAAVRNIILEPVSSIRPDGVVATIRRLNAQRRGLPVEEASSEGPTGPGAIFTRARAWLTKVTRSRA